MPITIRIPWAGGVGAAEHHSESPEAYFVHTSGLRVVAVSTPHRHEAFAAARFAIDAVKATVPIWKHCGGDIRT